MKKKSIFKRIITSDSEMKEMLEDLEYSLETDLQSFQVLKRCDFDDPIPTKSGIFFPSLDKSQPWHE